MYNQVWHTEDISTKRILVAGGAGFIGSHLVEYLLLHGAREVRVLDNLATGSQSNVDLFQSFFNFNFVQGSITDVETCLKACQDIDIVLHHAALGSVPRSIDNPVATHEVNATGFLNMLEASRKSGVKRFVYASSSSVYGDDKHSPKREAITGRALSPYGVTKHMNELYAAVFANLFEMDITGFRYFNIFGPRQNPHGAYAAAIPLFIDGLIRGTPVYVNGNGQQARDFTFVSNVVKANMLILNAPSERVRGRVFNIGAGRSTSILQIYQWIAEKLKVSTPPLFREARKGEIIDSLADISAANKAFGYTPDVDVKSGLTITVNSFL
jgi:UDP-N-acetylglucosamine/UDP-N-acetylgalactosamine 4-epimerase